MVFLSAIRLSATKRIPMIRFRAGRHDETAAYSSATNSSTLPTSSTSKSHQSTSHVIEDWQLPPRYQRKPIDQTEIEFINRGGPA